MFGYEDELQNEIDRLKEENAKLKLNLADVSCCHPEICIVEQIPTDGNVIQPTKIFVECTECKQILPIHRIIKREEKIPLFNDCS